VAMLANVPFRSFARSFNILIVPGVWGWRPLPLGTTNPGCRCWAAMVSGCGPARHAVTNPGCCCCRCAVLPSRVTVCLWSMCAAAAAAVVLCRQASWLCVH
jgi:hypothetical protein